MSDQAKSDKLRWRDMPDITAVLRKLVYTGTHRA
jgi:hypothetical protein